MSNATPSSRPCLWCQAPVVGFPKSAHRVCKACFRKQVNDTLDRVDEGVDRYVAGATDVRPIYLFVDPYTQTVRSLSQSDHSHDPEAPELKPDDLDLDQLLDRVPPGSLRGGLDAAIKTLNEASRARQAEAEDELDGVMEGIPVPDSLG